MPLEKDILINFSCICFFAVLVLVLISTSITADENLDTRENENITLKCRFSEQHEPDEKFFYYWARFTPPSKFENVAVSGTQLNTAYK